MHHVLPKCVPSLNLVFSNLIFSIVSRHIEFWNCLNVIELAPFNREHLICKFVYNFIEFLETFWIGNPLLFVYYRKTQEQFKKNCPVELDARITLLSTSLIQLRKCCSICIILWFFQNVFDYWALLSQF